MSRRELQFGLIRAGLIALLLRRLSEVLPETALPATADVSLPTLWATCRHALVKQPVPAVSIDCIPTRFCLPRRRPPEPTTSYPPLAKVSVTPLAITPNAIDTGFEPAAWA